MEENRNVIGVIIKTIHLCGETIALRGHRDNDSIDLANTEYMQLSSLAENEEILRKHLSTFIKMLNIHPKQFKIKLFR